MNYQTIYFNIITRDPLFNDGQFANHINIDNVGGSYNFLQYFDNDLEKPFIWIGLVLFILLPFIAIPLILFILCIGRIIKILKN
jgi:hypothetical protein